MDEHLDRLLAELGERSNAEIAKIQSEGRAAVDTIRRDVAARIAKGRDAAIAACEAESAERRAEAIAAARSRARSSLLRAQHTLVDRVLDLARAESASRFASACVVPTLVARTRDLLTYVPEDGAVVRCRAQLSQWLRSPIAPVKVADDDAADWGVIVSTSDGRLVVDDTVTTWFQREQPTLSMTICRRVAEVAA